MWKTIKNCIWPKRCINCNKIDSYLCVDCGAIIELIKKPEYFEFDDLKRLYMAVAYNDKLVQRLIDLAKNYIDASEDLANLIISHFKLLEKQPDLHEFIIYPLPGDLNLEIAKYLSLEFKIPIRESGKNILIVACEFEGESFFEIARKLDAEKVWGMTVI